MLSLGNKLTLNTQPIYHFVNKYSIDFDGVDDRIVTDGADTVAQNTTYSFWCKSSTTGQNYGVFGHGNYNMGAFRFNYAGDRPLLFLGTNYFRLWNDTPAQDDGKWHHWVVYSATNLTDSKLYVDGVLQTVNSTTSTGTLEAYTESLTIGSDEQVGGNSFEGKIDEFAVYDRELTQDEITRMYNTYYSPNRVANGNFSQIGNEEVTNGDFSQIGSEQVTNGDFATDTDWNKGGGITISGGSANFTGVANANINQNAGLVTGKIYKIVFTVSNYVSGDIDYNVGGNTRQGAISSNGTYTDYVESSTGNLLYFQSDQTNGFVGSIDNVSVKEVGQDWEFGGGWGMGDGVATATSGSGTASKLRQSISGLSGKSAKVTLDVSNYGGNGLILIDFGSTGSAYITSNGTHTFYGNYDQNYFELYKTDDFSGDIDNISVKEVGQHWTFGTGWSTDGTKAINDGSQSTDTALIQNGVFTSGKTYKILFDFVSNGQNVNLWANGTQLITTINTTSSIEHSFTATTSGNIYFEATSSFVGSVDNIVVQELKHDATNLMINHSEYQSANPLITSTNSMEFDGTDDYLQLSEPFSHTNHTICAWVNSDDFSSTQTIFDSRDANGDGIFITIETTGKIRYKINFSQNDSSTILNVNKWNNIVCSYNGTNLLIYINGILDNSVTSVTTVSTSTDSTIGKTSYTSSSYFDGNITEVGVYNRTLTSLEVASLYNQGMPTDLLVNRNDYQSGNPTVFNTKQVDFDGSDDYAVAGLGSPVVTGSNPITMSAWVKTDNASSNYNAAISVGVAAGFQSHYLGRVSSNNWGGGMYGANMDSGVTPTLNEWTHLLYTYAGGSSGAMKIYINGVEKVSSTATANIPTGATSGTYIGRIADSSLYFDGDISQVGIWNSTLTADEVSSLYNHGLPIDLTTNQAAYESSSNLVGYWRMGSGLYDNYPSIGYLTYGVIADQTNATLGSELIVNGDFATDSNWTKNSGWTISGGKARRDGVAAGGNSPISQTVNLVAGRVYKVSYDRTYISNGGDTNLYSEFFTDGSFTTLGSYNDTTQETVTITSYFSPTYTGAMPLNMYGIGTFTGTIDNVSLKEFGGNPAIMHNMFTSDIENGSPYANIVQNGDFATGDFTSWVNNTSGNASIVNNQCVFTNASSGNNIQQTPPIVIGKTYISTFDIISITQGAFKIYADSGGGKSDVGKYSFTWTATDTNWYVRTAGTTSGVIDNVTLEQVNTGLQGYWKMGDGTNDEYPIIYDQTNPTLGAEVVTNGDFATDSNWSKGTGVTITTGKAECLNTTTFSFSLSQVTELTVDKIYLVIYEISDYVSGEIRIRLGSNMGITRSSNGFYQEYIVAQSTSVILQTVGTSFTGSIDNVSVKQVQGNPATMTNMVEGNITNQYPLTKIRNYYRMGDGILDGYPIIQDQTSPNLAHIPTTNLLEHSERFTNGYDWTVQSGVTVTDNFATAPNGTQTAAKVIGNGSVGLYQIKSITGNAARSVYLKSITGNVNVKLKDPQLTVTTLTLDVTTEWQRFELSEDNGTSLQGIWIDDIPASGIYIWGAQLEAQSQATAYLKSDGIAAVRKATTTNLLNYSEDFSQSFWTKSSVTLTTGFVSPDGTNNAYKLVSTGADGLMHNNYTVSSGTTYTISVYLKTVSGTLDTTLSLGSPGFPQNVGAGGRYKNITVTNEWKRYSLTSTADASAVSGMGFGGFSGFSTGEEVLIWGMQLEEQTQAETYAKTTGLPVTIDLFTENNYGTMTNMSASDIVEDTPNN